MHNLAVLLSQFTCNAMHAACIALHVRNLKRAARSGTPGSKTTYVVWQTLFHALQLTLHRATDIGAQELVSRGAWNRRVPITQLLVSFKRLMKDDIKIILLRLDVSR